MKCHEALGKEGSVITLKLGLNDLKQWLKHTADLAATGKRLLVFAFSSAGLVNWCMEKSAILWYR